jgi:hypothetical protein
MHDDWLGLSGMKDCFIGLCSGGGWLTFCSAIVSSSMSNSSSSSSMLSLGLYRMVRSIFVSSGRMVGFLDRSPCMNQMKFSSYSSFNTAMLMSLELCSITEGCALDCTQPVINRNHRNHTAAIWNKQKRRTQTKIFKKTKNKNRIKIKQNNSKQI